MFDLKNIAPFYKILILIGLEIIAFVLFMCISIPFVMSDQNKNLLLLQAISTIVMFGGVSFVFYLICMGANEIKLEFCKKIKLSYLLMAICTLILAIPISNCLGKEDGKYMDLIFKLIGSTNVWGFMGFFTTLAILPAIMEEWLFRGCLQKVLISWFKKPWIGILVCSIIFSLIHFDMANFFARMVLSLLLGGLYFITHNIWTNILLHFINNAISAIGTWIIYLKGEITIQDTNYTFWIPLAVIAVAIITIYVMYNEKKGKYSLIKTINAVPEQEDQNISNKE